jgi:ribonuclease D
VEERLERLKQARNRRADALGIDRGTLISNSTLLAVALRVPESPPALSAVDGMRRWQAEVVGPDLLAALERG